MRILGCVPTYGTGYKPEEGEEFDPLKAAHPAFRQAFLETAEHIKPEHGLGICGVHGDGMLDRARAFLFAQYLMAIRDGHDFNYYWQLDGDVEWPPAAVRRWIDLDVDVVGAAYTYKVPEGHPKYQKAVFRPLAGATIDPETGLLECKGLAGGMIFVKHSAMEKLMADRHYEDFVMNPDYGDGIDRPGCGYLPTFHFWQCFPVPEECCGGQKIYLSEDYAFCERLRQSGFKIYLDTRVPLRHWVGREYHMVNGMKEANEEALREQGIAVEGCDAYPEEGAASG